MAKRKEQPPEEGSPAWMATFSDLMNLLLCFFVLLFASSSMDEGKIQKIAASFDKVSFDVIQNGKISLTEGEMVSGGVTQLPDSDVFMSEAGHGDNNEKYATASDAKLISDKELLEELDRRGKEQSEEIYDEILQSAESYSIDDKISIDYNEQYVELDLNGSILFDSGEAALKNESKMFMQKVARILVKYRQCIIEVEGHTDNIPISSSRYADNRALSAERARSVYEYIISEEHFIDANIKIAGYGESRPIASNATEEGRARNRRVSIKIYNKQNSQ
ncbi:MAG: flagellar motor protein MotB [Lachnospiraceae bacterium]|nr:flagellar motor protein MotB [Lachnospiraceae bacterium]